MKLEELKKLREERLKLHKKKKKDYYLKKKASENNEINNQKVYDYKNDLNDENFAKNIKTIIKAQKKIVDDRKEIIKQKITEYFEAKKDYYYKNKNKRLKYDKEYREKKKEDLKKYRKQYYELNKEKILLKQKQRRLQQKEKNDA